MIRMVLILGFVLILGGCGGFDVGGLPITLNGDLLLDVEAGDIGSNNLNGNTVGDQPEDDDPEDASSGNGDPSKPGYDLYIECEWASTVPLQLFVFVDGSPLSDHGTGKIGRGLRSGAATEGELYRFLIVAGLNSNDDLDAVAVTLRIFRAEELLTEDVIHLVEGDRYEDYVAWE